MHESVPQPTASAGPDTIAAVATALGGAVAVIRVSGPEAVVAVQRVWRSRTSLDRPPFRQLRLGRVLDASGRPLDQALAAAFPGPSSYTGELMAEVHCHGGPLTARLVLLELFRHGVRPAEPGEFTRRAFLNGKMDLTQAEAVADLIEAQTEMALRLANRQLEGRLGRAVDALYDDLLFLAGEVEARLDFPDEDLDFLPPAELDDRFARTGAAVERLLADRREGEVLRRGIRLVLAGPTNVGKSSLLNAILGWDRAIVTQVPGTTRDTLEELAHIRGVPVRLIDTAGVRETLDLVEKTGVERSVETIRRAEILLWVIDATRPYADQAYPGFTRRTPVVLVANKSDLAPAAPADTPPEFGKPVLTCALTGDGFEELFDRIEQVVWERPHAGVPETAVSVRHAALLDHTVELLADARRQCAEGAWENAAVTLRAAVNETGRITGRCYSDDLLDSVFARFCIGK
ncbi:MAG: tRNA uridine-5-carboxymethylaminomethyl(34) synthesis GTPase MnmE [Kiritimatiellaeota bacterium]|nr:tRNA uridine-5-carboxymethylaminomethyl(34) synthesis GTPase MnmE [Kiritimatiellota bacterium]